MSQPASYKTKISAYAERNRVRAGLKALSGLNWKTLTEQYCEYRLDGTTPDGQWLRAKQYTNGTFWLQSNQPSLLERALAELGFREHSAVPASDKAAAGPVVSVPECYMGTDESGKGDYFGPLVIAGVYVTPKTSQELTRLGVKDCKSLKDGDVLRLAPNIMEVVGEASVAVQVWRPEAYNQNIEALKAHGQTLNDLMAAGHAKVIERIDAQLDSFQVDTNPPYTDRRTAVVDQFAKKPLVQQVLDRLGVRINVRQETKAEDRYIAVAAASIIARAEFLTVMAVLSEQTGTKLPKGAGANVNKVAKTLWQKQGEGGLRAVCKWHFKTTQTVKAML